MPEAINLIPQQEKVEQYTAQAVKASSVFAIFLLIIVGGVSAFLFYRVNSLKAEIKNTEGQITQLRGKISALSNIEIIARNLDARINAVNAIFSSRVLYSDLLSDLKTKKPDKVSFTDMVINADNSIAINGVGDDYLSIADYMRNITDDKNKYTSITLNSVNLEESTQKAEFLITVGFNPAAFK